MSIVSHLHQLFNAATCQSYIHTLRWKDRPLQCPRCQSHNVGPWGTYHGFVANFTQEVVKRQLPLSVEGIRRPWSRTVRP